MPFLAQQHVPISNKDILSWIFDDQKYDADKPVCTQAGLALRDRWQGFLRFERLTNETFVS